MNKGEKKEVKGERMEGGRKERGESSIYRKTFEE